MEREPTDLTGPAAKAATVPQPRLLLLHFAASFVTFCFLLHADSASRMNVICYSFCCYTLLALHIACISLQRAPAKLTS